MGARAAIAAAWALLGCASALSAQSPRDSEDLAPWAARHAVPLPSPGEPLLGLSANAVDRLVGSARVVALGEPAHGAHEPLALRNAWIVHLVEHRGFTAVALETGVSQSRSIARFVACGTGDASQIALDGLSWGFGAFAENAELLAWLREWNCRHRREQVRFYGIDVQGGDAQGGMSRAGDAVDGLGEWLESIGAVSDGRELRTFKADFTPERYRKLSMARRKRLAALSRDAARRVGSAPVSEETLVARRNIAAMKQLEALFGAWPDVVSGQPLPPGFADVTALRDEAMADNLLAALRDEGASGRIVLFAHDGHIANATLGAPPGTRYANEPRAMGSHLRERLGARLRTIGVLAQAAGAGLPQRTTPPGTVEQALAGLRTPFLLRLHEAPSWAQLRQTITSNYLGTATIVPAKAYDAVVMLGMLTKGMPANKDR